MKLKKASEFKITRSCVDIGLDEKKEFSETMDAMTLFGLDTSVQNFICQLCAAILHLGELEFTSEKNDGVVISDKESKIFLLFLFIFI